MRPYFLFLLFSFNMIAQQCLSDIYITQSEFDVSYTESATYIKMSSSVLSSASITVDANIDNGYIELIPGFMSNPSSIGEFITELTNNCDSNMNRLLGKKKDNELTDNESTESLSVTIYPNPSKGEFFISGIEDKSIVKITSVDGKLIETINANNNSIIELNIAKGIYLVHVISQKKTIIKRVVLE